jgi:hypothetical protein
MRRDRTASINDGKKAARRRIIIARLVVVQAPFVVKALRGVAVAGGRDVLGVALLAPRVVAQLGTNSTIGPQGHANAAQTCPEPVKGWSVSRKLTPPPSCMAAILPPKKQRFLTVPAANRSSWYSLPRLALSASKGRKCAECCRWVELSSRRRQYHSQYWACHCSLYR